MSHIGDQVIRDIYERGINSLQARIYVKLMRAAVWLYGLYPKFWNWMYGVKATDLSHEATFELKTSSSVDGDFSLYIKEFRSLVDREPKLSKKKCVVLLTGKSILIFGIPFIVISFGLAFGYVMKSDTLWWLLWTLTVFSTLALATINGIMMGYMSRMLCEAVIARHIADKDLWEAVMLEKYTALIYEAYKSRTADNVSVVNTVEMTESNPALSVLYKHRYLASRFLPKLEESTKSALSVVLHEREALLESMGSELDSLSSTYEAALEIAVQAADAVDLARRAYLTVLQQFNALGGNASA